MKKFDNYNKSSEPTGREKSKSGFMTFDEFKKNRQHSKTSQSADSTNKKPFSQSNKIDRSARNVINKTHRNEKNFFADRDEKKLDRQKTFHKSSNKFDENKTFFHKDKYSASRANFDSRKHSAVTSHESPVAKQQPIIAEQAIADNSPLQYVAICQVGLENVLADEIKKFGCEVVSVQRSTVFFISDKVTMYKLNMGLRSAINILKPLKKIIAHDYDNLYHQARKINWHKMFSIEKNIRIDVKGTSHQLSHSQYVTHRVRDAIMDTFRKFNDGLRPSVDKDEPDIHIVVYLNESNVTFYLDSSGVPLFKRGYRVDEHFIAPLKEELAAGLVELSRWDKQSNVLDICCGSATLLIEAAFIATDTAPNLNRSFSFQNWSDYNENFYKKAFDELQNRVVQSQVKLIGYEIDSQTAKKATAIVKHLRLDNMITIINDDFRATSENFNDYLIITNPPYGQRLESDDEQKVFALYKDIGDFLKNRCKGSTAFVFTGNFEAMKHIGLRANRHEVHNGPIECRLLEIKCF